MKSLFIFLVFTIFSFANNFTHLQIDGAVSPASTAHLETAIQSANTNNSQFILLELNTPGGLLTSTRDMVQMILSSDIPIIVFVSPKGARAASAGTFLLYSSHIAAMAPGTNVGAATPVSMLSTPLPSEDEESVMKNKVLGDATAYIQSLSQLRERNEQWAIKAVTEGVSISAQKALELNVIEFIAHDVDDLLHQIDGYAIKINDHTQTLQTQTITAQKIEPDFKAKILSILTNPNVAYILMLVAIYGIFFELMNPGSIFPGAVGVISGVLALYALNILPFNYAGLLLIMIGIAFMIAEVFIVGFGIMGVAGVVAFVSGSLLLFDAQTLGQDISLALIVALALVSLGFFIFVMKLFLSTKKQTPHSGVEEMVGMEATILKKEDDGYLVFCHGETWNAHSNDTFDEGDKATVSSIKGLILQIKEK